MMVGFEEDFYGEETKFVQGLITEESVYCLPGSAFSLPNWFRLVLTYPEEVTRDACERIVEYCERRLRASQLEAPIFKLSIRSTPLDDGSEGNLSNAESDD